MSCKNKCDSSYFTNLVSASRQNTKERCEVVKGTFMKVNVMSIAHCGEIGVEVHENEDQLITIVYGTACVKLGRTGCNADCVRHLNAGESVFIPAGMWHNVCNIGNGPLKLISAYGYSLPKTDCGCVQETVACSASANTRDNVFHPNAYHWNTEQTLREGCNCGVNSGC